MKKLLPFFFVFLASLSASMSVMAQLGGRTSFNFLNLPAHARLAGLGGMNVSTADTDINFFVNNPALVSDSLAGWGSAGYMFYIADIGQTSVSYAHSFSGIGTLSMGVQHLSLGMIEGYDDTGASIGSFRSAETALFIGKSHQINNFRLGASVKLIFSSLAGFRASAVATDLGGVFVHPDKELTVGLAIKNLGFALSQYSPAEHVSLPFDVQAGVTFKPEHMPVRISATVFNLARPGDGYDDPATEEGRGTLDKVLSHFNFGAEIILHRHFQVLMGYNFLRQQELRLNTGGGGSGFTVGAIAKIKGAEIIVSSSRYSIGNRNYSFTLLAQLQNIIAKRKTI